ncbi:MAG: DUF6174 domain-containing protein [Treponema sp.]|jgi:hypothetical protein|nr:DUF6174 domain-containing protein [Treponema sp.]
MKKNLLRNFLFLLFALFLFGCNIMSEDEFYSRYAKDTPDNQGETESVPVDEEKTGPANETEPVLLPELDPAFSGFIARRTAWEGQGIDEYYITILHSIDDQPFYNHKVIVDHGVAENASFLLYLVSRFPFSPLLTIEEIYGAIETAFAHNHSVTIEYDGEAGTPSCVVAFENYLDSGARYTLDIDFSRTIWEDVLDPPTVVDPYLINVNVLDFDMEPLLREKSAWEEQNLQHYQFVIKEQNFALPFPRIQIVISPDKAPQLTPKVNNFTFGEFTFDKTISGFYASIEDRIKTLQAEVKAKPPRFFPLHIVIKFDAEHHYPKCYYEAPGMPEGGGPGDEPDGGAWGMEISDFEVLH